MKYLLNEQVVLQEDNPNLIYTKEDFEEDFEENKSSMDNITVLTMGLTLLFFFLLIAIVKSQ